MRPLTLAALLAANLVQAQFLIGELSFGHSGRISPEKNGEIPGFSLDGSPQKPEVLSNRVILTPLAPGNVRGAMWSQQTLTKPEWIADVDFRANGPERAGGNLNIWLAKDGRTTVASNSIYTVGRFDGLALVLDAHGGQGGMIRGFLNDGTTDYNSRQNIDDLAFGHCAYSYRNLGRPSQIKFRQTISSFRVEIDGNLCFETDKVKIPGGNYIGLTAATPDTPDSFEIFKMVVMSDTGKYGSAFNRDEHAPQKNLHDTKEQTPNKDPPSQQGGSAKVVSDEGFPEEMADQDAEIFATSKLQFADLHNRLQGSSHQLNAVHRTLSRHQQKDEQRHDEVMGVLNQMREELRKLEELRTIQQRLLELETEVQGMRRDTIRKLQSSEASVKSSLSDHHTNLSQALVDATPGHSRLIVVIVGSQAVLALVYVLYKRRKNNSPKKYL